MAITWGEGKSEHLAAHGVTIEQANEAYYDDNALVINPDYASTSGRSIRTIGYSAGFGGILTVITVPFEGAVYGATAFEADRRDRNHYEED
jgi:uncharacterized DUF497 family protein